MKMKLAKHSQRFQVILDISKGEGMGIDLVLILIIGTIPKNQ